MIRAAKIAFFSSIFVLAACQSEGANQSSQASSETAERGEITLASFNEDGSLNQPKNWRQWVFIGTPLTTHELNGGNANFPEFHAVYIDPVSYDHYKKTGEFRDGTQIVKELTLVRGHEGEPNNGKDPANGSTVEASGRGFFMGEYSGLEIAIKDSKRFKDEPGNWAYFTWGHKPFPYDKTASKFPAESCNACHAANADDDWVFTQFYPVLRAAKSVEVGSDQANAS